jgi:hypothetical protein
MLGVGHAFRDVPFFWSQHYDVQISYLGHAPSWDGFEVIGDLTRGNACAVYRTGNRVMAVATIGRDRVSLAAEAALEQNDLEALELVLRGQR